MKTKQLSYDARMYLCEDICNIANNLSRLDNDGRKTFNDSLKFYIPPIAKKNESDCFNFHVEDIKNYTQDVYNSGERPKTFIELLDEALEAYLYEKVMNCIDIVAYNFLINYVNIHGLNRRVSYEMIDTVSYCANEYTTPQELVDNLYSYLDD